MHQLCIVVCFNVSSLSLLSPPPPSFSPFPSPPPQQYAKYQKFSTEVCILEMGGILCPNRGCGQGLLPEEGRRVQCPQVTGGCGVRGIIWYLFFLSSNVGSKPLYYSGQPRPQALLKVEPGINCLHMGVVYGQ